MPFDLNPGSIAAHRQWLSHFDSQYRRNWDKLFENDPEAAMCEAEVRQLLETNGCDVTPNETLDGSASAPDFFCSKGHNRFYVEVTSVSIQRATEVTGLTDQLQPGPRYYRSLNDVIFSACRQKTPQCSALDAPVLVAVGTFHFQASAVCIDNGHMEALLTGDVSIACAFDPSIGEAVDAPYQTTHLRSAAFLRYNANGTAAHARCPVSGIVACGFGCNPHQIKGILHPKAARPFCPTLLPSVDFCRLKPGFEQGVFEAEWV